MNKWKNEVEKMYEHCEFEQGSHASRLVSQLEEIARGEDFGLGLSPEKSHLYKPNLLHVIQDAIYANPGVDYSSKREFILYGIRIWAEAKARGISKKGKLRNGAYEEVDSLASGLSECSRMLEKIRIAERQMGSMDQDHVWRLMAENREDFEEAIIDSMSRMKSQYLEVDPKALRGIYGVRKNDI